MSKQSIYEDAICEFERGMKRALTYLQEIPWCWRMLRLVTAETCMASAEHREIDTTELMKATACVLLSRPDIRIARSEQNWKLLIMEASRMALAMHYGECVNNHEYSPSTASSYLGIIVPSPNEPTTWIYHEGDYESGICRLSEKEKLALFQIWKARGDYRRSELIRREVWNADEMATLRNFKNSLHELMNRIRKKLPASMVIVHSRDREGYALVAAADSKDKEEVA